MTLFETFPQRLLNWFKIHQRVMPWRTRDAKPYPVWVSEIMLQQTQVDTVIPYFTRFMNAFPTVEALARAEQTQLLKIWEGLGYYTRVRNLQKGAQYVVDELQRFPENFEEWQKVCGVGHYTAAAISSIVYGEKIPVVDGNVLRVWARLTCMQESVKSESAKHHVFEALLPYISMCDDPSWFNQGMMELGALICRPQNPNCVECPLNMLCQSFKTQTVSLYPSIPPKNPPPLKYAVMWILRSKKKYALHPRTERLWHGLYVFPFTYCDVPNPDEAIALSCLKKELGVTAKNAEKLPLVQHKFSHFSLNIHPFLIDVSRCNLTFYTYDEINALPLPVPIRKVFKHITR